MRGCCRIHDYLKTTEWKLIEYIEEPLEQWITADSSSSHIFIYFLRGTYQVVESLYDFAIPESFQHYFGENTQYLNDILCAMISELNT